MNSVSIRTVLGVLILFALAIPAAHAQQVQATSKISYVLPTTDTLGQSLTGERALTKLQLFAGTSAIPDTAGVPAVDNVPPTATTFDYAATVPNGATLFFRLKACNAAICGALSSQATKEVRVSIPGVATGVQVVITVTVQVVSP